MPVDRALRDDLVAMAGHDQAVRAELAADGSLFHGYHPRMRAVHDRNAERLTAIIAERGWPGPVLVGEQGAEAAWLVLQHAIGHPDLQRRGLALLKDAAERGQAAPRHVAMLEDRIRMFEGRPQRFGTQYDWDNEGRMSPHPIEDEDGVDARRCAVGLSPLAENTARIRLDIAEGGVRPPSDLADHRRELEAWARAVGWRD